MQYTDKYRSPLGEITLASDGDHLTGLWFDGQKYFATTLSAEHQERELPIFELTKEWLDSYFMGKIPSFTPPIIIPCHRVVGSDGSLTGYAGGIDKKRSLLTIERAPKVS